MKAKNFIALLCALTMTASVSFATVGTAYAQDNAGTEQTEPVKDELGIFTDTDGKKAVEVTSTSISHLLYNTEVQRLYLRLPTSIQGSTVKTINAYVLSSMPNLEEIIATGDDYDEATGTWNSCYFCSEDGVLYLREADQWGSMSLTGDPGKLVCYPAGKTDESYTSPVTVTEIGSYAISRHTKGLKTVSFPGGTKQFTVDKNYDGQPDVDEDGNTIYETKTYTIESIEDYAFFGTTSVETWEFPEDIPEALLNNSTLFGGYDGSQVVTIEGETVLSDNNLTTDDDGYKSATINSDSVSKYLFQNSAVERVYIGANVTDVSPSMFSTARELKEFVVDENNGKYMSQDGVLYEKDGSGNPEKLVFYPTAKEETSFTTPSTVKTIGAYGIARQRNLLELNLSEGLTTIEDNAFFNSTSIGTWSFPKSLPTDQLSNPEAFSGGTKVDHLLVYDLALLEAIKSASVVSNCTVLEFMEGITELSQEDLSVSQQLEEIIIPASVTSIEFAKPYDNGEGYSFIFADYNMKSLQKITVAEDNKVYASDGVGIWEKQTGILRATAAFNIDPFGGTRVGYWETPDEVTEIAECGLILGTAQTVQIGKNVTKIANGGIRAHESGEASLAAITVAEGNEYFTSYDGVLFSKDMTRLIKLPPQINYDYTQWEVDMWYGTEGSGTRYFSDCYMIPKTVRTIDSYAFEDAVNFYTEGKIKYLYFPSFEYSEAANGSTPNYINDHILQMGEDIGLDMYSAVYYLPNANYRYYLYEYGTDNQEVAGPVPSDFCEKIGLASHSDYNDPNSPLVMDEYTLGYIEQYASSMVAGEGDPFVIKYSEYGTPNYVKPV